MKFILESWYQRSPRQRLAQQLDQTLERLQLQTQRALTRHASTGATLRGERLEPLTITLRDYTEDHQVLSVSAELPTAHVLDALLKLWRTCASPALGPWPAEVILAWGASQVTPLLTHSQWRHERGQPLVIMDELTLQSQTLRPQQPEYWATLGPRLHWLRHEVVTQHMGQGGAQALLDALGASRLAHQDGLLLDCGWSARWPSAMP